MSGRCSLRRRWVRRLGVLFLSLFAAAAASLAVAPAASAHPLGNFTVNQYSGLRVAPDGVVVDYLLDMAEVPAFQTRTQDVDTDRDGTVSTVEQARWRATACEGVSTQVSLAIGGTSVLLAVVASRLDFPPGTAGLVTLRLGCTLRAAVHFDRPLHLSYRDGAYIDRVGWREVTAVGDGTTLVRSSVPAASSSARLTAYPANLLASPLDVRGAEVDVHPGGARVAAAPVPSAPSAPLRRGVDRATSAFTALIGHRQLTVAFGLVAVLLSVVLGALHALAPGHGKTVMAAFLVGGRGSMRQAFAVGLTVTATHTVGVLVLGAVLTTSVALAPQTLYPWLGLASGVLLAGVGVTLFRRVRAGVPDDGHDHSHRHVHGHRHEDAGRVAAHEQAGVGAAVHAHAGHTGPDTIAVHHHGSHYHDRANHSAGDAHRHDHEQSDLGHHHDHGGPAHHHHVHTGNPLPIRRRALLAMGFAGGLVPSPSALVVLLGAVALGRTWFGILLVIGYGAGMAAALMGIGLLLARGRRFLERLDLRPGASRIVARLPVLTAGLIVAVGTGLAARAALALVGA